jgi:CubicO group peptidase (beta-lactamase class C family)
MKNSLLLVILLSTQISHAQTYHPENLSALIRFCDSTKADEILLHHKGNIIAHWKRTECTVLDSGCSNPDCGSPYMGTASMVKSWTGIVIGILIDKGLIDSVDAPVCKYIPEWKAGCRNQVTIRHLLTMTAGINRKGPSGVLSQANMNQYVLNLKPDTLPGVRFSYSNETVQLLGVIMENATGKKANEVFEEYLFAPLNMDSTTLALDSAGNVIVYGGCKTTVNDAAKIGRLMLNQGVYDNTQIVSGAWVKASVTPHSLAPYYGYLWWIDKSSPNWNYAATGDLGQMTIVFPESELIFVRKQICDLSPASINMTWMGPGFLILLANIAKP